jgi:hypothetical protein
MNPNIGGLMLASATLWAFAILIAGIANLVWSGYVDNSSAKILSVEAKIWGKKCTG